MQEAKRLSPLQPSPFPWQPERPPLSPEEQRFLLVVDGASRQLVYAAEEEEQRQNQHIHTHLATEEGRGSSGLAVGGESDADGPSEVLRYEEAREELDRARAKVAELEQQLNPQALVERDRERYSGVIDFERLVVTNATTWATCGVI